MKLGIITTYYQDAFDLGSEHESLESAMAHAGNWQSVDIDRDGNVCVEVTCGYWTWLDQVRIDWVLTTIERWANPQALVRDGDLVRA
jgi:hypothetical protein